MTNKNIFILLIIISMSLLSSTTKRCEAKYQTGYYGWSKTYNVDVEFAKGSELNSRTYSFNFDTFSTYAIIEWSNGSLTVIDTDLTYGLNSYTTSCSGKDQEGDYWKLEWSNYSSGYGSSDPYLDLLILQKQLEALRPSMINLKNNTNETIWACINYLDVSNVWKTAGWWKLVPGQEAYVADTHNRLFYAYAHNENSTLIWEGTDLFDFVNGSVKLYGFFICDTGGSKNFTQGFKKR